VTAAIGVALAGDRLQCSHLWQWKWASCRVLLSGGCGSASPGSGARRSWRFVPRHAGRVRLGQRLYQFPVIMGISQVLMVLEDPAIDWRYARSPLCRPCCLQFNSLVRPADVRVPDAVMFSPPSSA
jgi:hypothetical protein